MADQPAPPLSPVAHASPEASPLGRNVAYRDSYAPELLFPISRQSKRDEIGIVGEPPFHGGDLWNAYELSWLDIKGKPQVALATFWVPATSPNIIESKSLKLYLNAFNQTRLLSAAAVAETIAIDLSAAAGAPVEVQVTPLAEVGRRTCRNFSGILLDDLDIAIDHYAGPAPDLLVAHGEQADVSETLVSHLLKSNCLVTGQPDWASVAIRYRGAPLDRAALLRYLVSFRQHNEFHEQCVERIFFDLWTRCRPSELAVYARYTRRGGLDINPFRSSAAGERPDNDGDVRQ